MHSNFLKAQTLINKLKNELKQLSDIENLKGLENLEAYQLVDHLIDELSGAEGTLSYLNKPTKEGTLQESSDGKFFIAFKDGSESYGLGCGHSLELYSDDEWLIGRVEHRKTSDQEGYYFYGDYKPFLYSGMRVRLRVE